MNPALWASVWDAIDKTSQLIGILTIVPAVAAFLGVRSLQRQRRQIIQQLQATPGSRPALLIVSVNKPITLQVEAWRRQQEHLRDIPEERVFKLEWDKHLGAEDLDDFLARFREKRAEIMRTGADKIHLFYGGPVVVAAQIGAELKNGCPVILYHLDSSGTGQYANWGPLERPH